jgi:hypothetical protein
MNKKGLTPFLSPFPSVVTNTTGQMVRDLSSGSVPPFLVLSFPPSLLDVYHLYSFLTSLTLRLFLSFFFHFFLFVFHSSLGTFPVPFPTFLYDFFLPLSFLPFTAFSSFRFFPLFIPFLSSFFLSFLVWHGVIVSLQRM